MYKVLTLSIGKSQNPNRNKFLLKTSLQEKNTIGF